MTDERERLDVDVLFVGGGPASLSGALRLQQRVREYNQKSANESPLELEIAVIEKGLDSGAHAISGAVLDPRALAELIPDYRERDFPLGEPVRESALYFLGSRRRFRIPEWSLPKSLRHQGSTIGSLQQWNLWLAERVEESGTYLLNETCGVEILEQDGQVLGVRTGDKGLQANQEVPSGVEPGIDIRARVTIFGEGPHGTLTEDLIHSHGLRDGRSPQTYALGVKELIRVPRGRPGLALHTLGFPLADDVFGGGFCYGLDDQHFALGMICGLDWRDPTMDVQRSLQEFKTHPLIEELLEGGEIVGYGAKTLPEGGYDSLPRPYTNGALLIGDSLGTVNVPYLKGIHYAMKSGMIAAETAFDALLAEDVSQKTLGSYERRLQDSFVYRDLQRVRGFRHAFDKGRLRGMLLGGLELWLNVGRKSPPRVEPDFQRLSPSRGHRPPPTPLPKDHPLIVDKLTDLFHSGTKHREDQPSHIKILDPDRCITECIPRFGMAPCTSFCPAQVYELIEDNGSSRIQVQFSNCIHCKTCVIKDPLDVQTGDHVQNIDWRAPSEGGPRYRRL